MICIYIWMRRRTVIWVYRILQSSRKGCSTLSSRSLQNDTMSCISEPTTLLLRNLKSLKGMSITPYKREKALWTTSNLQLNLSRSSSESIRVSMTLPWLCRILNLRQCKIWLTSFRSQLETPQLLIQWSSPVKTRGPQLLGQQHPITIGIDRVETCSSWIKRALRNSLVHLSPTMACPKCLHSTKQVWW